MKRKSLYVVILALVAALIIVNFGAEANGIGADGSRKMKVTIQASCKNTNSVGNEWSQTYTLNGQTIKSGTTIEFAPGENVTFAAKVVEADDSLDDVGTGSKSITLTEQDIRNGLSFEIPVTVTENGGRYKGNKAVWTIKVSIK